MRCSVGSAPARLRPGGFLLRGCNLESLQVLPQLFQAIQAVGSRILATLFARTRDIQWDKVELEPFRVSAGHRPESPTPAEIVGRIEGDFGGAAGEQERAVAVIAQRA